jgi:SSS family solute:Na+ symporter
VFAAALKLIIPFIVCVPGIIAFTLYGRTMQENAMTDEQLNAPILAEFDKLKSNPAAAKMAFPFDGDFAALHPALAERILAFNAAVAGVQIPEGTDPADVRARTVEFLTENYPGFEKKLDEVKEPSITDVNGRAVALATGTHRPVWKRLISPGKYDVKKQQELVGYDYDGAFPLLMRYLTPNGIRGFVLAALMGAVVSSLASMLNAASTIFTMDLFKEYVNKRASQTTLVWVGRLCVPVFVVIGCLIAPQLADPRFKGAFAYIQEFQGYVSPGVLTIFLFGLFVPRTPRVSGMVGLLLSPVIYGFLHLFFGDMAFLNRMAITVGALAVVLTVLTLTRPLKEPVKLPVQSKIAMDSSKGAMLWGVVVVLATVALYVVFF